LERVLDANRTIGRPDKITVIFGRKITKHYRGKLQAEIEDMNLPNPVIRSHHGNGFIKQYVRDHLILRTEPASNNVNDYGVNKAVENLPALRKAMSAINDNYLNVQQDILEIFVDCGQLRKLAEPTITSAGKPIRASSSIILGSLPSCMHWCRSARLRPRALHARFAPLRPLENPRQGSCCQAPQLSPLSTAPAGVLDLPCLPEALQTRLRATHRRPSQPHQSRCTASNRKAIAT
jgi:hypothetical protein